LQIPGNIRKIHVRDRYSFVSYSSCKLHLTDLFRDIAHQNVLKCFGVLEDDTLCTFQQSIDLYVIYEGNVTTLSEAQRNPDFKMTEEEKARFTRSLSDGFREVDERGFNFGSVEPTMVVLHHPSGEWKIWDFAETFRHNSPSSNSNHVSVEENIDRIRKMVE
jgi:hypothetical protein